MGPDRSTSVERLLSWLGVWGAMRAGAVLLTPFFASILLCELLAPSVARVLPLDNSTVVYFFSLCAGLLLGLIGFYAAPFWDRAVFARWYGVEGRWRNTTRLPLGLFPPGAPLHEARGLLLQAMERKPETPAEIDREAVKIARRQAERWERIEHPLILADSVRGLLWPCAVAAGLGVVGAAFSAILGSTETGRLLGIAAGFAAVCCLLLVPYCWLRFEYLARLYHDITAHAPKKKQAHSHKSEPGPQNPGRPGTAHRP